MTSFILKALPLSQTDVAEATGAPLFRPATTYVFRPFSIPALIRSFIPGALALAMFTLSIGALFSANKSTSDDHTYGLLLSAGAAFVSAAVYSQILKIRDQSGVPVSYRSDTEGVDLGIAAQTQEMTVDVMRHMMWLLSGPLVVLKIIDLAGRPGEVWGTPHWTVAMLMVSVALSLLVRAGTDELVLPTTYDTGNGCLVVGVGGVLAAGSLALYLITLIDLLNAAHETPNEREVQYFAFLAVGYPSVGAISVLVRNLIRGSGVDYNEGLSFLKDVAYGIFDFLIIGVLAYGSTLEFLKHPIDKTAFFNATAA